MEKKNAAISGASILILLAILLILYIVALPSEEKCKIIPNLKNCGEKKEVLEEEGKIILLSENPGFLKPIEETAEYKFGSIDLFNREVSEIPLKLESKPIIERSWFKSRELKQEFSVPGKIKELTLFVGIEEAKGLARLAIILNGKIVAQVIGPGVHIVSLPVDNIKHSNTLLLKSSAPILPFTINRFKLGSLILKEKYFITQGKAERNFVIEEDVGDISSAVFQFKPDCYSLEPLRVEINGNIVVNEKICIQLKTDVRDFLNETNTIKFSTDGNYYINDVKLKIRFKKKDYITYYFTINKENYEKIDNGEVLGILRLRFPDKEYKKITVYINGNPINIETEKIEYRSAITKLLMKGQNSIKIVPETSVDLGQIDIYLE